MTITTNLENRTAAYRFTFTANCPDGLALLKLLRQRIAVLNAEAPNDSKQRVCVKPRLGRNSQFAEMYKGCHQTVKTEHGAYFDVYVQTRY